MKHLRYFLMAALVAMPLTACDEDSDPVKNVLITGTVTGTVSAEGDGIAGVTVSLVGATSQSTTTGAGGTYTFTNVEAGSYGVSITAPQSVDVVFAVVSMVTTIQTQGQTQTVDFAGSYIRTAAITGTVLSGPSPLAGVAVDIAGGPDNVTVSKVTGLGGEYVASGLRAGTYTVTLPDPPSGVVFVNTTKTVTVNTGETGTAHFVGITIEKATIAGVVIIDNVGTAGIPVALSGDAVAATETGLNGGFSFTNLTPGSYTVTISPPPDVTFEVEFKDITVGVGETGVVNFAGVGPVEAATISIQSITKGGGVIDLTDVSGQIEVALNITRNDQELDYVDVLIGDVVVATQDFANQASPAEAAGDEEVVSLNVPTTQVMMGTAGVWTPAVNNGGNEVSANLYVVEGDQPIPTNRVPVVMQNYDAMLPGMAFGGDLLFTPDEPLRTALGENDETWYAGSATFTGPVFLSYSTHTPSDAAFDSDCGYADTETIVGDYMTGITVANTYDCDAFEGNVEPEWWGFYVDYDSYVGPDGTAVRFYDDCEGGCMSAIGAEFFLSDGTVGPRRFVISDPVEGQIEDSNDLWMDNLAPDVSLDEPVAFNDDFSEWWVKGDYDFVVRDVLSEDGGVGFVIEQAFLWVQGDPGSCTGLEVFTPATEGAELAETLVSDGDPDGYQICGYAVDALLNGAYTSNSNWFGVDMVAPQARIWGDDDSEDPGVFAPIGTASDETPVSATMDQTVYGTLDMMGTGDFHYTTMDVMEWGLDAIDDRSGLDDYDGDWPFMQMITHDGVVPTGLTYGETAFGPILPDNWVRVDAGTAFLNAIDLPGIYIYEGYAVDRAGNESVHFTYNWLVDDDAGPVTTAITPVTTSFAPGAPAMFNVWGSDDLEVTELGFDMLYPTSMGDIAFFYGGQPVAADRWDNVFYNLLAGDQYGVSTIWGRIDFTDDDGAVPGTMVYAPGEDALPTDVSVFLSEDAGYNPGQDPQASWTFIEYAFGGWDSVTEAPWPDANLDFFTITDDGEDYVVEHIGDSSVDAFIMDEVWLVVLDPNTLPDQMMTICAMKDGSDNVNTDNGTNRFYTYTFDYPLEGNPCYAADLPAGASIHAVGVKSDALLVTDENEIPPPPVD